MWTVFKVKAEETAGELGLVGFSVSDSQMRVVSVEPEAAVTCQTSPASRSQFMITVPWSHFTSHTQNESEVWFWDLRLSAWTCHDSVINVVAASYSLGTWVTSNQYFPENKTLSTLLRKTTPIRNPSVHKNKSPTKEEKYLSSSQSFIF